MFFSGVHILYLFKKSSDWLVILSVGLRSNRLELELNVEKTKYKLRVPKETKILTNQKLNFTEMYTSHSKTIRFLVVAFHEMLSWTPHIACLGANLCPAVGALNRLRYYYKCKTSCLLRAFSFAAKLLISSFVYHNVNLNNLTLLQKQAIRATANLSIMKAVQHTLENMEC